MSSTSLTPSRGAAVAASLVAVTLIASPLTVCVAVATPLCLWRIARGLPGDERRLLIGLLAAGMVLRLGLVAAQMLIGLPLLNDTSVGALAGDESYYLSRALRVRDLLLGYAVTKYDYFVATDSYGQTSYLSLLTALQVMFGPTPYSMKALNGLLYVCGAGLLFRIARSAFGTLPSFLGLAILLFLPSLFFSSVSLLKESAYFLAAAVLVACAWQAIVRVREGRMQAALPFVAIGAISLVTLDGLRRGGLVLMAAGLICGLGLWLFTQSRRRLVIAALVMVVAMGSATVVPAARDRLLDGVATVAKMHAGHVFTVGHVYKLMDEGFYANPTTPLAWDLQLSVPQATRFLLRAGISFIVTPWPWEMRSMSELAFMPEHVIWYVLIAALPFGIAAGWRRDPMTTALLIGFALPTAAVVAVTNGNVGTLLRMRGLVTPFIVWLSAVGLCALGERLAASAMQRRAPVTEGPAL